MAMCFRCSLVLLCCRWVFHSLFESDSHNTFFYFQQRKLILCFLFPSMNGSLIRFVLFARQHNGSVLQYRSVSILLFPFYMVISESVSICGADKPKRHRKCISNYTCRLHHFFLVLLPENNLCSMLWFFFLLLLFIKFGLGHIYTIFMDSTTWESCLIRNSIENNISRAKWCLIYWFETKKKNKNILWQ